MAISSSHHPQRRRAKKQDTTIGFGHCETIHRRSAAGPYSSRHSAEVGPPEVVPGLSAVGLPPHHVVGRVDDAVVVVVAGETDGHDAIGREMAHQRFEP
jgi:hypothetical protein